MAYQVEAYMSGGPCHEQRFTERTDAEAYRTELHDRGFYFVDLFDVETADRAYYGTRINWSLDDPRSRPWLSLAA